MEVLVAIAADEERLLLHCGLFEPLPLLLVLLLLVELSKLLVKCPLQDLVPLLNCLLPYPINILMFAFCADQELLDHPLIAPPGIPGQLLLSVLVKMRIQRGVSNKYHG